MKKINNTLFIITIVAISTFLISIPRALSACASAQAEAKSGKANTQSYAQAQSNSTTASASSVNINPETNKTSAIPQIISETSYSSSSTQLVPKKVSQNQEDTRDTTVGEQNNINNEQQSLELKKLIENNKNSLETIAQRLEDVEDRQIKALKMFIFNLVALAVIILLELVLIFRRLKH